MKFNFHPFARTFYQYQLFWNIYSSQRLPKKTNPNNTTPPFNFMYVCSCTIQRTALLCCNQWIYHRQDDIVVKYQLKPHHFRQFPITVTWSLLVSLFVIWSSKISLALSMLCVVLCTPDRGLPATDQLKRSVGECSVRLAKGFTGTGCG